MGLLASYQDKEAASYEEQQRDGPLSPYFEQSVSKSAGVFTHGCLLLHGIVTSGRHGSLWGQSYIQRVKAIVWDTGYDSHAQVGTQEAASPNKIQITHQHLDTERQNTCKGVRSIFSKCAPSPTTSSHSILA